MSQQTTLVKEAKCPECIYDPPKIERITDARTGQTHLHCLNCGREFEDYWRNKTKERNRILKAGAEILSEPKNTKTN